MISRSLRASSGTQPVRRVSRFRATYTSTCLLRFALCVFFFLFASLLLHIHTHATNYLKNFLSHLVLSFVLLHSLRSFFTLFFFWFFSLIFSYKTKWHLFGIGRKNTLFNVYLSLLIRVFPSLLSLSAN